MSAHWVTLWLLSIFLCTPLEILSQDTVNTPPQLLYNITDLVSPGFQSSMVVSGQASIEHDVSGNTSLQLSQGLDTNPLSYGSLTYGLFTANTGCLNYSFTSDNSTVDVFLVDQQGLQATFMYNDSNFSKVSFRSARSSAIAPFIC